MSKNNDEAYLPEDAANLRRATAQVIDRLKVGRRADALLPEKAANAVLSVVRSGYARDPIRPIDADDLAEAAAARLRDWPE